MSARLSDMEPHRRVASGERHSLVQASPLHGAGNNLSSSNPNGHTAAASRRTSVPLLDEESLKANQGVRSPRGSSVFTLVAQGDDGPRGGAGGGELGIGSTLHSPSRSGMDSGHIYSMLQQQQAVAMAAAQLEQAYSQTCFMLQQCSPQALLTVLMSLLNDYPTTLIQPIRARVEQVLAHQMSPSATAAAVATRGPNGGRKMSDFVPNSSAAPWTPMPTRASAAPTPTANSTSPSHRRGRGHKGKEEEQEMCSLHHNMRAMKHLQLNNSTGLYECIHGFHCLVDGPPDASARRASVVSAVSPSASASRTTMTARAATPSEGQGQPFSSGPYAAPPAPSPSAAAAAAPAAESPRFSVTEVEALRMLGYSMQNTQVPVAPQGGAAAGGQSAGPGALPSPYGHAGVPGSGTGLAAAASRRDPNAGHLGNGGFTVVSGDPASTGTSPPDTRLNMDIPSLEYLLQSVRDIDDE